MCHKILLNISFFSILLILNSCKNKRVVQSHDTIGYYGSVPLDYHQRREYRKQYGNYFYRNFLVIGLELKEDSTFLLGFCDSAISTKGNWCFQGDSIKLYNIYDYRAQKKLTDRYCAYSKKGHIFVEFKSLPDKKPFWTALGKTGHVFNTNFKDTFVARKSINE